MGYAEAMKAGYDLRRNFIQAEPDVNNVRQQQTASILRYVTTGRDASIGVAGTRTLTDGLANLPVVVEDISERELNLSMGRFDYKDKYFVFFDLPDIFTEDQIVHNGSTYNVYSFLRVPGTTMTRILGKRQEGAGAKS